MRRISYLVDVWHALWLVKLQHASITCSLRHPILSLSILNVILFGAIYHRLLVKPHPESPQPLPVDVSTQRTKYKTILRQWAEVAKTDLLHSFFILCSVGSPFSYLPVSCRVAVSEYDFLGWISEFFKKTSTQLLTTHFLTSGPLLYSYSSNARPCQFGCFNTQKPKWRNGPHRVIPD